jgi:hypothetical protein
MSNKNFLIILAVMTLIFAASYFLFREKKDWVCVNGEWMQVMATDKPKPAEVCGEKISEYSGEIISLLMGNIDLSLSDIENVSIFTYPKTKFLGLDGNSITYAGLRPGFKVKVSTITDKQKTIYAKEVQITEEPAIILESPQVNTVLDQRLMIQGQARVYTNKLKYKLKDYDDRVLAEGSMEAGNFSQGRYGDFKIETPIKKSNTAKGMLEISYPVKGSAVANKFNVSVQFKGYAKKEVKIFFSLKKSNTDCSKVQDAVRVVPNLPNIATLAIQELLKGPYLAERYSGFSTNINMGTKLNKLSISKQTAYADFSRELDEKVAGSCRVTAIRAQIESTLKQFSSIKKVVISVNGRTRDILQP